MNTQAGAWALIYCRNTGRFLLGKRSGEVHKPHLWNFFGGHLDDGETAREALLRELAEEAGLTVAHGVLHALGGVMAEGPQALGYVEALRQLHYFLLVTDSEIVPVLNHEHACARWFAAEKIPHDLNRPSAIAVNIGLVEKVRREFGP